MKQSIIKGDLLSIDLRNPIQKVVPGPAHWQGSSLQGDKISFTNFYMELNAKPILLIAGEIHPTRTCEDFWEESILRMKSGGLNTISFYILWNHIEQRPGKFDFTGNRNIKRFVELCKKHGMFVWPRIGPFCNSEALHGGLPSWLYGQPMIERSNDPNYLFYVERLYKEIAKQFEGLFFKDSGPIIAIQIENEYGHAPASWDTFYMYGAGPVSVGTDGESHMKKLKELAIEAGIVVPVYSCTGWGSPIPKDEYLPVYGCYAYLGDSGPTETSTFSFGPKEFDYPPAFAELGGGAPTQRTWRPIIPAESAEVGLFTRVACGGNMTGLYIYHGGTNPTSYDRFYAMYDAMTLMSYDWNSPISEFGIIRDSYYQVRPLQQFLNDYGEMLCPMVPVWQSEYVEPENTEDLRYMARVNANSGFLFLNNYQDKLELPDRENVKIELILKDESFSLPEKNGFKLKKGVMAILPFNMKLGGGLLKYSTTQPLCNIKNDGRIYYFFFAHEDMKPEYMFDNTGINKVTGGKADIQNARIYIEPKTTGFDSGFDVETIEGTVTIVTLTYSQAKRCIKTKLWGKERLLYSNFDVVSDGDVVKITSVGKRELSFSIFPELAGKVNGPLNLTEGIKEGIFTKYEAVVAEKKPLVEIVTYGDDRVVLKLSEGQFQELNDIYLKISYSGDIARVFADGLMVTDHINDQIPWFIGLKRFMKVVSEKGLFIKLEPERDGFSKIVFDGITFHMTGQRVGTEPSFKEIEVMPEYLAIFSA